MRLKILFLSFFCFSCLKRGNVFQKFSKPISIEKQVVKNIENKKFREALDGIISLIGSEKRNAVKNPLTSPEIKADLLQKFLIPHENGEALIFLYSIAVLGSNGIDLLDLSLAALKKGDKKTDHSENFISIFTQGIPKETSYINSLKTVLLLSEYKKNSYKKKSILMNEILVNFIALASQILLLDRSNDGRIVEGELASITEAETLSMYKLLSLALDKINVVVEKDPDNIYKTVQSRILDIEKKIKESPGADKQEKMKNYLINLHEVYDFGDQNIQSIQDAKSKLVFIRSDDTLKPLPSYKDLGPQMDVLRRKRTLYMSKFKKDDFGWIRDTKCDGLLFNAIASLSGVNIPMIKARNKEKRWFRHASQNCYSSGGAKSSISRDMLLGLLLWIYSEKKNDILNELIQYGSHHKNPEGIWVMGEGDIYAVGVNERLQKTFFMMQNFFSRTPFPSEDGHSWFFHYGYEGHLEVLHMLLRISMRRGFYQKESDLIQEYVSSSPNNALFGFVSHLISDGDFSSIAGLLSDDFFPQDRLPSTRDRCSFYLWERRHHEENGLLSQDWAPCPQQEKVFSGIDFLFIVHLLETKHLF
ncbi:MAG: hypothetical protein AB8C84_07865 [Oligoflexales bacterium]